MAVRRRTREKDIVKDLALLLRENGEKILQGNSRLCLTTICLKVLHDGFSTIVDQNDFTTSFEVLPPNSPQMNHHDLQFLYDFVQKTNALKVIHGSSTLQGRVNITSFRALDTLELKRIPLHLFEGLAKARPRLTTLICTRCLHSLQELLETCGGDKSVGMSWPTLLTACFSYNALEYLDNSLKLLPSLEVLDLSHNSLRDTNSYLKCLSEIKMVNLGYNQLENIPLFSLGGRARLHTLILRNNNLDDLQGLEDLTGLHHLDLANNCLCSHQCLTPLQHLQKLSKLYLKGNPLSFHQRHRVLTVGFLHPPTALKVFLDEKQVTRSEYMQCTNKSFIGDTSSSIASTPEPRRGFPRISSYSSFDQSYESTTQDETDPQGEPLIAVRKKNRKSNKPSRRARKAIISDLDSNPAEESSPCSSQGSTPASSHHLEIKEKVEIMRNQLGSDWLHTLAVQHQIANQKHGQDSSPSGKVATDDDLYLNERDPQINSSGSQLVLATSEIPMTEVSAEVKSADNVITGSSGKHEEPLPKPEEINYKKSPEPELTPNMSESDTVIVWRQGSSEVDVDYGPESEPFIVTVPENNDLQLIVTLTERYLLEKDLNGAVVEKLDLQLLKSAHRGEDTDSSSAPSGGEGEEGQGQDIMAYPEMKLRFDYVRKDRQKRRYIMEDENNTQMFEELLRPFLQARELADQIKDQMQCLKCGSQFRKQDANREVRRIVASRPSSDITEVPEKDDVEEVLLCPQCGKSLLIELDAEQVSQANSSNVSTPIGSYQTSAMLPIATSSAHPSPWKHGNSPKETVGSIKSTNTDASSFKSACENPLSSPGMGRKTLSSSKLMSIGSPCALLAMKKSSSASRLTALQDYEHVESSEQLKSTSSTSENIRDSQISENSKVLQAIRECEQSKCDLPHSILMEKTSRRGLVYPETTRDSRPRYDSSGSDILILSHQNSQSSDISVLTNPSQASIMVLDSESSDQESVHISQGQTTDTSITSDLTPCGSLNNKTLSSMVSSVYEKSLSGSPHDSSSISFASQEGTPVVSALEQPSESFHRTSSGISLTLLQNSDQLTNGTNSSLQNTPLGAQAGLANGSPRTVLMSNGNAPQEFSTASPSGKRDLGNNGVKYSFGDFSQVDHRLKLYFMMTLFDENEEFALVLKCGIVQYSKGEEFQGLLVASCQNIYILRLTAQNSEESPEKWLKVVQTQPITELQYVDIGLGYQSLRLEFNSEISCFICLLRDQDRCKCFVSQFTALIQGTAFSSNSRLQGINKFNPAVQASLEHQILVSSSEEAADEVDSTLLSFCLCYQLTGEVDKKGEKSLSPVSLILTRTHLFLAVEDYCLPVPRILGGSVATGDKKQQFNLKDRQRIIDITSLNLYEDNPHKMTVQFMDEESCEEYQWHVVMETLEALQSLVDSIKSPWEDEFSVELTVTREQVS